MSGACSTHGSYKKGKLNFGGKTWMGETTGNIIRRSRVIVEWILEKYDGNLWAGFIWHRIRTSGGLLWTR